MRRGGVDPSSLALSIGDPSGIGPEIAIAAWQARERAAAPAFYLLADPALVASRARLVGADIPIEKSTPEEAGGCFATALPVVVDAYGEIFSGYRPELLDRLA